MALSRVVSEIFNVEKYCDLKNPCMGLSRTVSEIDGVSGENRKKNFHLYFAPPLKGFPLELDTDAWGQKTRMMGLPDGKEV